MAYIPFVYTEEIAGAHETRERQYGGDGMLDALRRAVEAAIPGCRTTLYSHRRAWVYMPEDVVAMGQIGSGVFSARATTSTYMVQSRRIENKKYSSKKEQHHMVLSKSLKSATTAAKTYLRSVSMEELAREEAVHARYASGTAQQEVRLKISKQQRDLFGASFTQLTPPSPVLKTITVLIARHPELFDPTFMADIQTYTNTVAEHEGLTQGYNANFVAVTKDGLGQRVTVVPVDNVHTYTPKVHEPQVFYDEVPEHIAGKISVLSMVEPDTYVPGVGYRHKAGMFYVSR